MSEIDSLIVQAEEDVESAKKRLAMLKQYGVISGGKK